MDFGDKSDSIQFTCIMQKIKTFLITLTIFRPNGNILHLRYDFPPITLALLVQRGCTAAHCLVVDLVSVPPLKF